MQSASNPKAEMFLFSSCNCLCPIHWNQVLSREWRCGWSSTDRRCSNYNWVIHHFIAYQRALILEVWGQMFSLIYIWIYHQGCHTCMFHGWYKFPENVAKAVLVSIQLCVYGKRDITMHNFGNSWDAFIIYLLLAHIPTEISRNSAPHKIYILCASLMAICFFNEWQNVVRQDEGYCH